MFFFFNDTATTEIYTLSLHDALPISQAIDTLAHRIDTAQELLALVARHEIGAFVPQVLSQVRQRGGGGPAAPAKRKDRKSTRLNSSHSQISYAVFCL